MKDVETCNSHINMKAPCALEQVFRMYAQSLIRYAYSLLGTSAAAEDVMEDTFAALIVKGGTFRSSEHLRAWLYKTAHNRSIDYLRRHKREVPLEDVENVLHTWDAEQDVFLRQRNGRIYSCMQQLPVQYREVLQLSYFDGFDIEHICAIQHKTTKQVYNLLARAKASLKELLIKEGITHEDLR